VPLTTELLLTQINAPSDAMACWGKVLPISEPSFMFFEHVAYLPCNFFFDDEYLSQMVKALKGDGMFCVVMCNHSYTMVEHTIQECYICCYILD
jgi:hypothetical protein